MSTNILVLDDDARRRAQWVQEIRDVLPNDGDRFPIHAPDDDVIVENLGRLQSRQSSARAGRDWDDTDCMFDTADILVVDYDLINLNTSITGESIAYLARCFSRCGFILELNQFGENNFDLSMSDHFESWADLNVGSTHVGNRGLWHREMHGFHPSHWVAILDEVALHAQRLADVRTRLSAPILECLGFPAEVVQSMPRAILQHLGSSETPERASFAEFVRLRVSGLTEKDAASVLPERQLERIAAARVARWLRDVVVPRGDVLVDAPHLVARLPHLLCGDRSSIDAWNACTTEGAAVVIGEAHVEAARFRRAHWLSRAAWFWPKLASDRPLTKASRVAAPEADVVFCEDVSRFVETGRAKEFLSGLESDYARRYVLGDAIAGPNDVPVKYEPRVRFAM